MQQKIEYHSFNNNAQENAHQAVGSQLSRLLIFSVQVQRVFMIRGSEIIKLGRAKGLGPAASH